MIKIFLSYPDDSRKEKASRQGRAASPRMELLKGVWGRCPQQAKMNVPPRCGAFIFGVMVPSRIACWFCVGYFEWRIRSFDF